MTDVDKARAAVEEAQEAVAEAEKAIADAHRKGNEMIEEREEHLRTIPDLEAVRDEKLKEVSRRQSELVVAEEAAAAEDDGSE